MSALLWRCAIAVFLVAGCAPEDQVARGAALARSPSVSDSRYNAYACTTCHAERADDAGARIFPGAALQGATRRPSWWGGNALDLDVAVNHCVQRFMRGRPLDPAGDTAQALRAWLHALPATDATAASVPFVVAPETHDLAPGDSARGAALYERACSVCHGAKHTGEGRISPLASVIPDETLAAHWSTYGPACTRGVFIEKVRHGVFFGLSGTMPPFTTDRLSDAQLADILAYLEVPIGGACAP